MLNLVERSSAPTPLAVDAEPGTIIVASRVKSTDSATVRSVLAGSGTLQSELYRLVTRHCLNPLYPGEVHSEAAERSANPGLDDPELEDLEHLPFVTIDNRDSRDLDQALFIERSGQGYKVWYALADAEAYVQPGSALFAEALHRGSSYYLPGLTLPMLPRLLCEDVISLNQGVSRRALVFEMELDTTGRCVSTILRRGKIRSRKKLSYPRVQRAWDDPGGSSFRNTPFQESMDLLRDVGELRIADARRRHVVQYNRSEIEIRATATSPGYEICRRDRLEVEAHNEQISLLCNTEGARLLVAGRGLDHVQPIFRVHPEPSRDRVETLEATISGIVRAHELDPSRWGWRPSTEPLAVYLEQLPRRAHPRVAAAIDRHALLSNHRSIFTHEPARHYGVGSPVYARFSSPMREIVGIFTHKEALELLGGSAEAAPSESDIVLRDEVVEAGNRSKATQRTLSKESHRLVMKRILDPDLQKPERERAVRRGTLLGMKPSLLYVRLDDPPLEIKIHLRNLERLTGLRWRPDRIGVELRPPQGSERKPLRVGDAIEVRLAGYQAKRRRWLFTIESES